MTEIELAAPAPSPEALDAAIGEGADAVYLALNDDNAGTRSAGLGYSQFESALRSLHRMGRKLYVTLDTVFEQREAGRVYQLLKYLAGIGPDAVIVRDFGIISMVRDNFPSLKLHASTQMNIASAKGANLLSRYGFSRTVLARELTLEEIRDIRSNTNMELEVFVHGSLCISVSGLCLFSSYLGGKSANRGICTQACRRSYTAEVGENGSYYFSPADLELIEKIPVLAETGINAVRIEGRMRSAEYVGTAVSAYRLVIDSLEAGEAELKKAIKEAKDILKNDFARSKTAYFFNGLPQNETDWLNPEQNGGIGIPLGTLIRVKGREEESRGLIPAGLVAVSPGDSIRLHKEDDSQRVSHKLFSVERGADGGSWISIPAGFDPGDRVYLIQTKSKKRYTPVIAREGSGSAPGRRIIGRAKAPLPLQKPTASKSGKGFKAEGHKNEGRRTEGRKVEPFPAGIYAMVARTEDLYVLQSSKPEKVILPLSFKCAEQILGGSALPFPARDIILSLDPFFPQSEETELEACIAGLVKKGYSRFIVNNLGHFSLFRSGDNQEKTTLVAGPWLYAFNAWAWDFIRRCGVEYGVSALENNRQNLERTFPGEGQSSRSRIFITVFSQPALFRVRQDLGELYDFQNFSGAQRNEGQGTAKKPKAGREEAFCMAPAAIGTNVYPWEPFSIVDKIPFLREAGFTRFILDFSPGPLKKPDYRDIMGAVINNAPIHGSNRFNWKNGFYHPK